MGDRRCIARGDDSRLGDDIGAPLAFRLKFLAALAVIAACLLYEI
jgi:hypothetical protein